MVLGSSRRLKSMSCISRHKQNRRFWLAARAASQNLRLPQRRSAVFQFYFFLCPLDGVQFKLREAEISRIGGELRIRLTGDGFLYNMVRIIVGTLIEVGRGER